MKEPSFTCPRFRSCLMVATILLAAVGCGSDGAAGADGEDGAAGADGENGLAGDDGASCWDLDNNGSCDTATEDLSGNGTCGIEDCDGPQGDPGGPGAACWDLDGEGDCDLATEDTNTDALCDVLDCQGDQGDQGGPCPFGEMLVGWGDDGSPICAATDNSLRARIGYATPRGGSTVNTDWQVVPGVGIPFLAAGGPVQVSTSIPLSGGSSSTCRPMIDGIPAGLYNGTNTAYIWGDGLALSNDGWVMWNNRTMYEGLVPGIHVFTVECITNTGTTSVGNNRITASASIVPYSLPASAEVQATSAAIRGGATAGSATYTTVAGLTTTFEAQGGPVRIDISIPMTGGSTATCRPAIDGVPAGAGTDNTNSIWEEGLTRTNDGWALWNRSRIYTGVAAGSHTATVECRTDAGTINLGNDQMNLTLGVITYADPTAPATTVHAHTAVQFQSHVVAVASEWVALAGLETTFTSNGGPVEIGVSIPMSGGSSSTCRPILDGAPLVGSDDFTYIWHEGLARTNDGWIQWDRIRMYDEIPAGVHTVGVECRTDSGTLTAGRGTVGSEAASSLWAVAFD